MSKNKQAKVQKTNLEAQVETVEEKEVETSNQTVKVEKKQDSKKDKQDKNSKKKPQKEKGKLKRKAKETVSEIKKVTWPTFGEVCKKTGVVLVVVLIFAVVVFGLDMGLGSLMGLLRG